jgi:hypothetical protein
MCRAKDPFERLKQIGEYAAAGRISLYELEKISSKVITATSIEKDVALNLSHSVIALFNDDGAASGSSAPGRVHS